MKKPYGEILYYTCMIIEKPEIFALIDAALKEMGALGEYSQSGNRRFYRFVPEQASKLPQKRKTPILWGHSLFPIHEYDTFLENHTRVRDYWTDWKFV